MTGEQNFCSRCGKRTADLTEIQWKQLKPPRHSGQEHMKEETLLEKVTIAIMFTAFVVLICMLPDLGRAPCDIDASDYVKRICKESKAK